MKGASPSTKGKAKHVRAGSRFRPFRPRVSRTQLVRRVQIGVKLAPYSSSSDGSPERPVKVVVGSGDAAGGGGRRHICVPVFGGADQIPRSSQKIGAGGTGESKEAVKLGADDTGESKEGMKLGAGGTDGSRASVPVFGGGNGILIGESGSSSMSIPKMGAGGGEVGGCGSDGSPERWCNVGGPVKLGAYGGGRMKEAVKVEASGSDETPKRVVKPGRTRLRVDNLGQLYEYVLDTEDEGSDMELGLYAPDSEEEDGGSPCCGGHCELSRRARLDGGRAMDVPMEAAELNIQVADPAPEVVDVPVGAAAAPDELHPEGWLKVFVFRVGQLFFVKLDGNIICEHAKVMYHFVEANMSGN